ncbi:MAG: hypothetical protein EOO07_29555, partial [Chitinophagaceae bacterium]
MIKREKAITSTISNLLASYATLAIGLVTGIIITRSLGPELKGEYTNLKLITTLYAPFLTFGYQGGIIYYGLKKQLDLNKFFWTGWLVTAATGLILTPLFFPLIRSGYLGNVVENSATYNVILGLIITPFVLLNLYCERVIRSYHLFRASNLRLVLGALVTLVYYIISYLFYKVDLSQAMIGLFVGQFVQLILNLYFVIRHIKVSWYVGTENMFKPWDYGIKTWINQIIAKSNDKFDLIILT